MRARNNHVSVPLMGAVHSSYTLSVVTGYIAGPGGNDGSCIVQQGMYFQFCYFRSVMGNEHCYISLESSKIDVFSDMRNSTIFSLVLVFVYYPLIFVLYDYKLKNLPGKRCVVMSSHLCVHLINFMRFSFSPK